MDKSGDPKQLFQEQEASHASFEDLQRWLMNNPQSPGGRVGHPVNEEDEKSESD